MPVNFSLRNKLVIVFTGTIVIPFLTLSIISPYYYKRLISEETQNVTSGAMKSLSRNIKTYLDDLDRLTLLPYYNDDLIQALKITAYRPYDTLDTYTKLKTSRSLSGTLPRYLVSSKDEILNTVIVTKDGEDYLSSKFNGDQLVENFPYKEQNWYQMAIKANGKAAFIGSHVQNYLVQNNEKAKRVFSVARLIKDTDSDESLAVIIADADNAILGKLTEDISFSINSMMMIMDENNQLLYTNKQVPETSIASLADNSSKVEIDSQKYLKLTNHIESAHWKIVVLLSEEEMNAKIQWLYNAAIIIAIGGIVVTFLIFMYFTRWIITPFKRMIIVMGEVRQGNLQARFTSVGRDEISQLGSSLNKMIYQLDDLINREYKTALTLKDAEYKALQSQIQPHFLYNLLSGFIGLNRIGEKTKLEEALFALSGMLRYILATNQTTTIEQEFQILQGYGLLQKLRFNDKLHMQISFEKSVESFHIPKLLIQPILENAIIHGVEPSDKPCNVEVKAYIHIEEDMEAIQIKVSDTGVGFDIHEYPTERQHIGIANVRERLKMLYPDASFFIESQVGVGTTVLITIGIKGAFL
ncbi:cache domain-containing sensor histidine kinase [Paenibacillus alba]|uniref:Histidine kinase n=1 Tax=Paenibacillus alba TaxID=1197127 RepID=A0ABU6G8B9_9BACL|nr:histidine kinase [Paenibacillus alba]MEC0230422.1 histidine kinase [Paenibacillus alba]